MPTVYSMDSLTRTAAHVNVARRRSEMIATMREIATIPPTTPPVMAAIFERPAPGGKKSYPGWERT